jgi:hypothetical protein
MFVAVKQGRCIYLCSFHTAALRAGQIDAPSEVCLRMGMYVSLLNV